jgi:hypothetical protein
MRKRHIRFNPKRMESYFSLGEPFMCFNNRRRKKRTVLMTTNNEYAVISEDFEKYTMA